MGIITKEVEVRVSSFNVEYYRSLGYQIPMKKASKEYARKKKKQYVYDYSNPIIVKIQDLQKGSHVIIEVLCDCCNEKVLKMTYNNYNQRMEYDGIITCKKCGYVKRKNTYISKYGVDNYAKTKECHEKMKNTIESRYGVVHYSKTQEYKEKFHNTCVVKYGENYSKQFTDKAFASFCNKTGYNHPFQSPEVREKIMQSNIDKYGVSNPAKLPEVREKMSRTLYANSSQRVSKQQNYINALYNGILNFPIKYYNADICLLNDNLTVEYDGGGHDLRVTLCQLTQEEFEQKEIIRNNVIKKAGYKQMRIISSKDKLPSDEILLQMLENTKFYFSEYPNRSWIEWNIDTSTVRNAEHKEGIFFDFGTLHTIKDSDLNTMQTTK